MTISGGRRRGAHLRPNKRKYWVGGSGEKDGRRGSIWGIKGVVGPKDRFVQQGPTDQ